MIRRVRGIDCVGFLDAARGTHGTVIDGIPVIGGDERLDAPPDGMGVAVALGNMDARRRLFERARASGYALPPIVDPSAELVSSASLGAGVFVSLGAIILNAATIGDYALIGTGVKILHDTQIGANCIIGGGTIVGANVVMGDDVFTGVGAVLASGHKTIGTRAKIGAGAVVVGDVPPGAFVLGNPARVIGRAGRE